MKLISSNSTVHSAGVTRSLVSHRLPALSLSRTQLARQSALLILCHSRPQYHECLSGLSRGDWKQLLYWLDTSGLALYFLDRMMELNKTNQLLPDAVLARLMQNLADNTKRTAELIDESISIQQRFQHVDLCYATMKGFSLEPISVPRMQLRSQLDLDFLIRKDNAEEAKKILQHCGYQLKAVSGSTWEFLSQGKSPSSISDLYKPGFSRSVELHLEATGEEAHPEANSLLSRREWKEFHGISMPVLPAVDVFMGQGLHLFKHLCSEFTRTAHMVEYRRHILTYGREDMFWEKLRNADSIQPGANLRIGVATYLVSQVMDFDPPEALTKWTVNSLPEPALRWVDRYGMQAALATFPGTKLYFLLQQALQPAGLPPKRSLSAALLPRRLPPAIAYSTEGESLISKLEWNVRQLRFILFRLKFHTVEGLRLLLESVHWRRSYAGGSAQ